MINVLVLLFNLEVKHGVCPVESQEGDTNPIYKENNLCSLDVNNYRCITFLTTLNKIMEILIWNQVEFLRNSYRVISGLQGTCTLLCYCSRQCPETYRNVFVAYFDFSKALDTGWINGVFSNYTIGGLKGVSGVSHTKGM